MITARLLSVALTVAFALDFPDLAAAADGGDDFAQFIKTQAAALRAADKAPATLVEWNQTRARVRERLLQAWGGFPAEKCPLEPRKLGELQRDGYRVEKIAFRTRPGIWMTCNAYVPDRLGQLPAVMCAHGHGSAGKEHPGEQTRCIGLVKLGFFVLAVDAFGAGERSVSGAINEYHGGFNGAPLLPVGLPLCGLQVYDNTRAVDYLLTRPEVDGRRIGITGASGGGNQSIYAGAWDDRIAAVAPFCSVGTYQAFLGASSCVCPIVPGGLAFTEEWGVLGTVAPRALLVGSATKDLPCFAVPEVLKTLAFLEPIFQLHGKPGRLCHASFELPHGYHREMRETMYGWMTLHLKGEGDGSPIPEPAIKTEPLDSLRCFPVGQRPGDLLTMPQFAAVEAQKLLAAIPKPSDLQEWRDQAARRREALEHKVLGGTPRPSPLNVRVSRDADGKSRVVTFAPEPGLTLTARQMGLSAPVKRLAILLDLAGAENFDASALPVELTKAGWSVVTMDVRATGKLAPAKDARREIPDFRSSQWGLWIGRPLLGQWCVDVRRLLDALAETDGRLPKDIAVIGVGPAGVVALCAGALDPRVTHVASIGTLASYVTDEPYQNQRLGIMAPGILRDAGDIPHIAALLAPRRLLIAGAVTGAGRALDDAELEQRFAFTRRVFALHEANPAFTSSSLTGAKEVAAYLQ
jgi:cephalosporin-C deacetylase-like acetyl esterase